jgi:hypothetical protein
MRIECVNIDVCYFRVTLVLTEVQKKKIHYCTHLHLCLNRGDVTTPTSSSSIHKELEKVKFPEFWGATDGLSH